MARRRVKSEHLKNRYLRRLTIPKNGVQLGTKKGSQYKEKGEAKNLRIELQKFSLLCDTVFLTSAPTMTNIIFMNTQNSLHNLQNLIEQCDMNHDVITMVDVNSSAKTIIATKRGECDIVTSKDCTLIMRKTNTNRNGLDSGHDHTLLKKIKVNERILIIMVVSL